MQWSSGVQTSTCHCLTNCEACTVKCSLSDDAGWRTGTLPTNTCRRFVPAAGLCTPATEQELSTGCNQQPCETFAYSYTPAWGNATCSTKCGGGYQSYNVQCVRSVGASRGIVADSSCGLPAANRTLFCAGSDCTTPEYRTSSWQACNATCGGGVSTRDVTCYWSVDNVTQVVDATEASCTAAGLERPSATRACNTAPCVSYLWSVTEWSLCSPAACGGTRTRTVSCRCSAVLIIQHLCGVQPLNLLLCAHCVG